MKILNDLTIKHLTMNKRRTIVSIIGIILSTALMVGIGLLISSFSASMLEKAENNFGTHNVIYKNLTNKEYKELQKNIDIDKIDYVSNLGFSKLEESVNDYKPYLFLQGGNKSFLKTLTLLEGRLPQNDKEVVLSNHISNNGKVNIKVGSNITLKLGKRYIEGEEIINNDEYVPEETFIEDADKSVEYKVVGIVARNQMEDYSAAGYTVYTYDSMRDNNNYNFIITFKNPKKTYDISKDIEEALDLDTESIDYNSSLLYYYGASRYDNINNTLVTVLAIALTILSIGCAIVIYNSFAISTTERKKQFGLLSSIGATKKQIRNTVFYEAVIVGFIGIVIGVLGAILGIGIVLQILNKLLISYMDVEFHLAFTPLFIIIPLIFMIVVIFISAFVPARRSSKITPIEAIRLNDDIKINKKKIRTSKLIGKVFGVEGEIALKNIKRNKKKYRITIISLFVSIVLFISFSTYLQYGVNSVDSVDYIDYDAITYTYSSNENDNKEILKTIKSFEEVENTTSYKDFYTYYKVNNNFFTPKYQKYLKDHQDEDSNYIDVVLLDDNSYEEYLNKIKAPHNSNIMLNLGNIVTRKNGNRKTEQINYIKDKNLSEIKLCVTEDDCKSTLTNLILTEEIPFGFKNRIYDQRPILFVNKETFEKIMKDQYTEEDYDISEGTNMVIKSKDYEKLDKRLEKLSDNKSYMAYDVPAISLKEQRNFLLAIKILLYGFITLVTLIGVTSVFNTISTSIMLRKKEFAMLRSVGLTPKGFNKILFFESLFFGFKSLLYAIPVSLALVLLIHSAMANVIDFGNILIPYKSIIISIIGVFILVLVTMMYSSKKIKKENILETIREENI